jgi:alpha-tubulin suppressor-like RCC1 family protein
VGLGSGVTAISAGGSHTCALTTGGGVKCWGEGYSGQLGDGTDASRNTPVDVVGLGSGVAAVSAGGSHTCVLTTAGGVKCWGYNDSGELGDGTKENKYTPVEVVGLANSMAGIAAGTYHTCALTTAGSAICWGGNLFGELGDGSLEGKDIPVNVVDLDNGVVTIAPGQHHTCALTNAGGVKCWGYNEHGQLGIGMWAGDKNTPVDVVGMDGGVSAISTGGTHTCALTNIGGVKCWGYNGYSQLGNSTTESRNTPDDVVGLDSGVAAVSAGGMHTCALTTTGGVKCWGSSYLVGDGTVGENKSTPVDVVGLGSGVAEIAAGSSHTCARTMTGGVKCWGANSYGQLGDGTSGEGLYRITPVDVSGLGISVTSVSAGRFHTCALTTAGGVKCWGGNGLGQLGDGTKESKSTPVDVVGLSSGVAAVSAGDMHTCALTTTGGVKCWGASNVVGDGTAVGEDKVTPVDVVGLGSGVADITTGSYHTCALTTTGGARCWGGNLYGQLGDGTKESKFSPVDVVGLGSDVIAIAAGGDYHTSHTCALTSPGGVKCWGHAHYGELGDGSRWRTIPVDVVQRIEYFSFLPAVQR